MKEIDAIILQDYNKGNLTKNVIEEVISYANKKTFLLFVIQKSKISILSKTVH